jgi:hypothetical protein
LTLRAFVHHGQLQTGARLIEVGLKAELTREL